MPGHDRHVTSIQSRRTAQVCAAYLLPHLKPNTHLLDIGCGPGAITRGFVDLCPEGHIVGVDSSSTIIAAASSTHADLHPALKFSTADVYTLPFDDASFDVVHAHQLFHHLPDAERALRSMKRVTKPGGLLAVRGAVMRSCISAPESSELLSEAFTRYIALGGGDADVMKTLPEVAVGIGLEIVSVTGSFECFVTKEDREAVAETWIGLGKRGGVVHTWKEKGIISDEEFTEIGRRYELFRDCETGMFMIPSVELLCRIV